MAQMAVEHIPVRALSLRNIRLPKPIRVIVEYWTVGLPMKHITTQLRILLETESNED
jgi:hypothetical protein